MKTTEHPVEHAEGAPRSPSLASWTRPWLVALLLVGLAGAAVMAFFLMIYPRRGLEVPIGWDNVDYIWRTRLAQVVGIHDIRAAVPSTTFVKEGRPAFLVVAATLSSFAGLSLLFTAIVLPAVMAATMGLAAGALSRMSAGLRRWELPMVAGIVGISLNAVLMIQYGYVDNLMMAAVFLLAACATVAAVRDRRALPAAILFLGAAGLIHGALFIVALAVLGTLAVGYLPSSWRAWRTGREGLLDTPSARVGQVLVGAGAVAAATIFGVLSGAPSPRLSRGELAKKLREDLPRYRWSLMLPAAAAGLGAVASDARRSRPRSSLRFFLSLLAAWGVVTVAGYGLYRVTHLAIPANRLLLFALVGPILAGLGALWLGRMAGRASPWLRAAVLVALLAGAWAISSHEWMGTKSWIDPAKLDDAATAGTLLRAQGIPADRPIVFVVDDRGPLPAATVPFMRDHLFAELPIARLAHTFVYVGSPDNYLARRPSLLPDNHQYNVISQRFFQHLESTYGRDPVALITSSYNQAHFAEWVSAHPDSRVTGTDLAVVRGPAPPAALPPTPDPAARPGVLELGFTAVALLAVLGAIGLGWVLGLLRRRVSKVDALALAPAAGLAVLVLVGTIADRLGARLIGLAGVLVPVGTSLLGWGIFLAGRRGPPEPDPSSGIPGP